MKKRTQYYKRDEIKDGFILDYDADGNIGVIEILEASSQLAPADLRLMTPDSRRRCGGNAVSSASGQRFAALGHKRIY